MNAWFISDIHLKDINERSSIKLLRFLSSIENRERPATHLFLLGDIFDLWVSNSSVFVYKYQALVDSIKRIRDMGVEVVYFEGNHDLHVKKFWQDELQIATYVEHRSFQLGPYTVRAEHGDLINPNDLNYLKLREFLRSPWMERIAHSISGILVDQLGQLASKLSRSRSHLRRQNEFEKLRQMIRDYAQNAAKSDHFDFLITGHMHVQDTFEFDSDGRKVTSINLGSWFEGAKALHLNEQGCQFVSLD